MFGSPETTPGGKALKFYASVRCDIRRIGAIKAPNGEVLGNRTRVKVVKNKVAPPFTEAEFDIMYNEGISKTGSLLDLAVELGIVEKKGAWISFEGNHIGQGRDAAKEELKIQRSPLQQNRKARARQDLTGMTKKSRPPRPRLKDAEEAPKAAAKKK
jgi:recombination protein RecA